MKTSLLVNRGLWEEFKLKVGSRVGLRALSRAVEELLEEGVKQERRGGIETSKGRGTTSRGRP